MNWIPLDERFKLRKSGQAKFVCLCSDTDFPYAENFMRLGYGPGQLWHPGDGIPVPDECDWFYSWSRGDALSRPIGDFRIYCRREEQKAYLMLKMLNIDWFGNWIGPKEFVTE